jgi:hypothetical protein
VGAAVDRKDRFHSFSCDNWGVSITPYGDDYTMQELKLLESNLPQMIEVLRRGSEFGVHSGEQ